MEIKCLFSVGDGANCYLIKTEEAAIVIDPYNVDGRIVNFLSENKQLKGFILLTHCHYDHILGAQRLRDMFGAEIAIGEKDETGLRDTSLSLSEWVGLEQKPFSADITFTDGDVLKIRSTEIKVIHTPGHTAGSVCYMIENSIFTGDTIFEGTVGRTDFPTGDFSALKASLDRLKALGQDYKLYPGHGLATSLLREIQLNPYMKE